MIVPFVTYQNGLLIILAALMVLYFHSCTEEEGVGTDTGEVTDVVEDSEETGGIVLSILHATLSNGWIPGSGCHEGNNISGTYAIDNMTGCEIRLCSLAVEVYQDSYETGRICYSAERERLNSTFPTDMSEEYFLFYERPEDPPFTCTIPSSEENCGEAILWARWTYAAQSCSDWEATTASAPVPFRCGWTSCDY